MPTVNITGGTADGHLIKSSAVDWAGCLAAVPAPTTDATSGERVKRYSDGATAWQLYRSYLCFDLSPYAGLSILAATLNLYLGRSSSGTVTMSVYYKDWGTELLAADWSADLGALTVAKAAFNASSAAYAWNALELTNLSSLLTSNGRFELALDDETDPGTASLMHRLYFADDADYKPYLTITYPDGRLAIPAMFSG